MSDKLTDSGIPAATDVADDDFVYVVDVSDTTDDPAGSSKRATGALVRAQPACKAFLVSDNTVNNNTSFTGKNVFPTSFDINTGTFTVASSGITVPVAALYMVTANCRFAASSNRVNPGIRFAVNGVGQTEESCSSYIRNGSGHNDSSTHLTTILSLAANDLIGLEFQRFGASGTTTLQTTSHVVLTRIG